MLAWKGHEFGVIWGYGRKAGWVIGPFWKGEEEKEKEKRAAKLKFEQVKQVFIFLWFFFLFTSQTVPAAVPALHCSFQHFWFAHSAVQVVTAAQLNHSSLPLRLHSVLGLVVVTSSNGSIGHTRIYSQPPGELQPWIQDLLGHRAMLIYLY